MMPKYIIYWDAGCGSTYDLVEEESEEDAIMIAEDNWKEETESSADYGAVLATKEMCEDHDLDWEE